MKSKEKFDITRARVKSKELSVIDKVRQLYREYELQEFVEAPSDEQYVLLVDKAINELNMIDPVTLNLDYTAWVFTPDAEMLLVRMTLCVTVEHLLASYTHKGIEAHSIEDIQVSDRTQRYEALLQRCDKDGLKNSVKAYKTAKGLGVDTEKEGLFMGKVREVHLNDFDILSSINFRGTNNLTIRPSVGVKLVKW